MGCGKSSSKEEVYKDKALLTRSKISHPTLYLKKLEKEQSPVSIKEGSNKDQSKN